MEVTNRIFPTQAVWLEVIDSHCHIKASHFLCKVFFRYPDIGTVANTVGRYADIGTVANTVGRYPDIGTVVNTVGRYADIGTVANTVGWYADIATVVNTVGRSPASAGFKSSRDASYAVYQRYQTSVHGDSEDRCRHVQWKRFLVTSPLKLRLVRVDEADVESLVAPHALFKRYQKAVHHETDDECNFNVYFHFLVDTPIKFNCSISFFKEQHPDAGPSSGLGSFHQQYWLDGEKLIAVAVIDILPCCVSSVYFYYDPEYSFLSLGTYSSLRELALTRELGREYSRLAWYYMGFYIHSCPKMRYKGHYEPSFLLCPETYSWCPLPPSVKKLDVNKYSRLVENSSEEDTEGTNIDIDKILVLHQRRPMRYGTFRELKGADEALDVVVREYAGLVGKTAACTMMLSLP
ncbi:hypothetical protein HAZT_HAZT002833 [Hyalella azteca]|uniref:N-end rule aminoacyl transferase C-terminal domain-containing protein n=1 Tax=Hyalella azteca TaxID=294128 RepID=A0A6A0GVJ2_HYAAZ|nr:hypothetical protein HAZT_HAZT002833 [Hyalella azteca]